MPLIVYVGITKFANDEFPLERCASTTLEGAKRHMEKAVQEWLGWKPGLNTYELADRVRTPQGVTMRWLDIEQGGALYGNYPEEFTLEQDLEEAAEGKEPRAVAIVYALTLDGKDER